MIVTSTRRLVIAAFTALALPSAALAQEPAAAAQPSQEQVQSWLVEMQQIHGKLQAIQQQALQDPQLQAAQDELGMAIKGAMEKADPTLVTSMARAQTLEQEAMQAQQQGDQAKLQQLGAEAQQIQQKFFEAQQEVLEQPAMAARVEAFQTRLQTRMAEMNPEAKDLMTRFRELEGKLATAVQPAGQQSQHNHD